MLRRAHNKYDLTVIGGGATGLAAAHHAARSGQAVLLFEPSGIYGGQIATIAQVEGLPIPGEVSGQAIAIDLVEKCQRLGVDIKATGVERVETNGELRCVDQEGGTSLSGAIVIASGATLRKLGVPGENELAGRGISHCADCDGPLFRGKDVVVVGAGDAAAQEAVILSRLCRHVTILARGAARAKQIYTEKLRSLANVTFVWDVVVEQIRGKEKVEAVSLRSLKDGGTRDLECAAVFPFVGTAPNSGFVPRSLCDADGYVVTDQQYRTQAARVFAAGAVRRDYGGQISQAVSEGVSAAQAAISSRC